MSINHSKPSLIIVMGVSGTGKSSLATLLADAFEYRFVDADDFHDTTAKAQMSHGISLTDSQRQQWIERLSSFLFESSRDNEHIVLAYSGLKKHHRNQFRKLPFNTDFILLEGNPTVISARIQKRKGHFVDASFLNCQLEDMEWPKADEPDIHYLNIERSFDVTFMEAKLLLSKHDKTDFLCEHL